MLLAEIRVADRIRRFSIEKAENEDMVADYLYSICEDVLHPLNDIPYFIEASAWCFNGRDEGDEYIAEDEDGNVWFTIEIVEQE